MFTSAQTMTGNTPNLQFVLSVVRCGSKQQHARRQRKVAPAPSGWALVFNDFYSKREKIHENFKYGQ
jgi:hypothetical protein